MCHIYQTQSLQLSSIRLCVCAWNHICKHYILFPQSITGIMYMLTGNVFITADMCGLAPLQVWGRVNKGNVHFYTNWASFPMYIGRILCTPMQNCSNIYRKRHLKIVYPYAKSSHIYRRNFAYPMQNFCHVYRKNFACPTQNFPVYIYRSLLEEFCVPPHRRNFAYPHAKLFPYI